MNIDVVAAVGKEPIIFVDAGDLVRIAGLATDRDGRLMLVVSHDDRRVTVPLSGQLCAAVASAETLIVAGVDGEGGLGDALRLSLGDQGLIGEVGLQELTDLTNAILETGFVCDALR